MNLHRAGHGITGRWRRRAGRVQDGLEPVADAAEDVSNARTLDAVARFGYAVTALLHLLIGSIAIRLALGGTGEADTAGAIETLAQGTPGRLALWAGFIGCMGLALWQLSEATVRARHLRGRARAGKAIMSGGLSILYGVLSLTFANFTVGPGSDSSLATRELSSVVLNYPFGSLMLSAAGMVVAGVGVYFVIKGLLRKYRPELYFYDSVRGSVVDALGITGHVAKGIALVLVGVLFGVAAVQHGPGQTTGLDGSLKALLDEPAGQYVVAVIGVGFICHGIFGMIRAKYGRM